MLFGEVDIGLCASMPSTLESYRRNWVGSHLSSLRRESKKR